MGHGEWVVSPPEQDLLLQAFKPIIPAEKGVLNCPKLCDRNTGGSELTVQATVGALGSLANLKHADVFLQKHKSSQIYPASISQSSWLKVDTAQKGVLKLSQLGGSDIMTYILTHANLAYLVLVKLVKPPFFEGKTSSFAFTASSCKGRDFVLAVQRQLRRWEIKEQRRVRGPGKAAGHVVSGFDFPRTSIHY